ncbi:zinc finger imprinted 3-like [Euwallacea similis]|uniref:zinc finger imprinted 3-like n=1 Tax=Euwallacea similis TaxID=1736056 RepID=UPI0034510C62
MNLVDAQWSYESPTTPQSVTEYEGEDFPAEDNRQQFACPKCLLEFNARSKLFQHCTSHGQTGFFPCLFCPYIGHSKQNLINHLSSKHQSLQDSTCELKPPKHVCPKCPESFPGEVNLFRHMKNHVEEGKVSCPLCPFRTEGKNPGRNLMDHRRTMHVDTLGKCPECGVLLKKKDMKDHQMSVHLGKQKMYKCSKCCERFYSSGDLNRHLSTHVELMYRCSRCGKTYKYKWNLLVHERKIHEGS